MCFHCVKKNDFYKRTNFDLSSIREYTNPLYVKKLNIKCSEHQCCGYNITYNRINRDYDYTRCTNTVKDAYVCGKHSVFVFNIVNSDYTDIQLNKLAELDFKNNRHRNFPSYYTMIYTFFYNKGYYSIRAKDDAGKKIFLCIKYFDSNGDNFIDNIYYLHNWEKYHSVMVHSETVFLTLKNILKLKLENKLPIVVVNEMLNGDIFTKQLIKVLEAKLYLFHIIFQKNDMKYRYDYILTLIKKFLNDYKCINNEKINRFYLCIINKIFEFKKIMNEEYKYSLTEEQITTSNQLLSELHKLTNYSSIEEFKNN